MKLQVLFLTMILISTVSMVSASVSVNIQVDQESPDFSTQIDSIDTTYPGNLVYQSFIPAQDNIAEVVVYLSAYGSPAYITIFVSESTSGANAFFVFEDIFVPTTPSQIVCNASAVPYPSGSGRTYFITIFNSSPEPIAVYGNSTGNVYEDGIYDSLDFNYIDMYFQVKADSDYPEFQSFTVLFSVIVLTAVIVVKNKKNRS